MKSETRFFGIVVSLKEMATFANQDPLRGTPDVNELLRCRSSEIIKSPLAAYLAKLKLELPHCLLQAISVREKSSAALVCQPALLANS